MFELDVQFIRQLIANKCGMNSPHIIRYLKEWKQSQRKERSSVADRRPWLTFQAISFIAGRLRRGDTVFEYGGGGSTLFYLDRGAKVVTVEHDKDWHEKLSAIISRDGLESQWQGIYAPPEDADSTAVAAGLDPHAYASSSPHFRGKTFRQYVSKIDLFPDSFFDFVVIDGRARSSCVFHAICKVKPGGCLILDNTERAYLTPNIAGLFGQYALSLDAIGPSPYVDFFTRTHIWVRSERR